MKKILIEILKGSIVGMGMIAPGLSGGVFAVSLGVYDRIIAGIDELLFHPIKVIKDLFWIGLGGIVGFGITFLIILSLIQWLPLPFSLFFIGFIFGAVPAIYKKQKDDVPLYARLLSFGAFFGLIVLFPFLPQAQASVESLDVWTISILTFVGFILAGTLIIPGISGSLVMMALGYYDYLFETANALKDAVFSLNLSSAVSTAIPLVIMGVGLVIGLVLFSKLVTYLTKRHQSLLYSGILGLLVASPFSIMSEALSRYENIADNLWVTIPLGVVFFAMGIALAFWMDRLESVEGH